jgi:nucleoside-diphosphate-sugar epimerase
MRTPGGWPGSQKPTGRACYELAKIGDVTPKNVYEPPEICLPSRGTSAACPLPILSRKNQLEKGRPFAMHNVLITGGAGYVGHLLTPRLISEGYHVTVYDQLYFGCRLPNSPDLKVIQGDIRDTPRLAGALVGQDAVLHLACISNDASFELDEKLSESINYDCFEPLVIAAKKAGVKRFVYCSSSSVYGVSDSPDVTEDHPLVPLTLYNKFKGMCEPVLWKHKADDFTCVVIRPATICGYTPRTRLDLSVNILTNHAVNKGTITVFGGNQMRPNLHVDDMVASCRTASTTIGTTTSAR